MINNIIMDNAYPISFLIGEQLDSTQANFIAKKTHGDRVLYLLMFAALNTVHISVMLVC